MIRQSFRNRCLGEYMRRHTASTTHTHTRTHRAATKVDVQAAACTSQPRSIIWSIWNLPAAGVTAHAISHPRNGYTDSQRRQPKSSSAEWHLCIRWAGQDDDGGHPIPFTCSCRCMRMRSDVASAHDHTVRAGQVSQGAGWQRQQCAFKGVPTSEPGSTNHPLARGMAAVALLCSLPCKAGSPAGP